MTPMKRRSSAGFTLLELLISLGVLAFMMLIAWGSIRSTVKAKKHFEAVQERYRGVRTALARIEKDLSMAYLSGHQSTLDAERRTFFVGESSMSYDTLRFTSFAHQRLYTDANESDQTIISYYTGPDPDDSRLTVLYRKETHRLANPAERYDVPAGDADILFSGISKFKLQYWNVADKEWEDTWSTISADGKAGKLPDRVKITLSFRDERDKEVSFVTQTKLPLQEMLQFYAN